MAFRLDNGVGRGRRIYHAQTTRFNLHRLLPDDHQERPNGHESVFLAMAAVEITFTILILGNIPSCGSGKC